MSEERTATLLSIMVSLQQATETAEEDGKTRLAELLTQAIQETRRLLELAGLADADFQDLESRSGRLN